MKAIVTLILFLCSFWVLSQCISGDCKNGYGELHRHYVSPADGLEVYKGNFKDGKRNGQGICKYNTPEEKTYDGEWVNDMLSGKGTMIWANGDRYEGEWAADLRNGKGIQYWSNGTIYDGEWKFGVLTGKGTIIWANGDRYEGDFVNSKRQGEGKYTYSNGAIREGEWRNGEFFKEYKLSSTSNNSETHKENVKIGDQILNSGKPQQQSGVANPSTDLKDFVKIGSQYWSRKNLNVTTFRNGDIITEVKSVKEWNDALNKGLPACMCLEFKAKNANKFGRIYNWYAIIDGRGLTPAGSHIPDSGEWATFILSCGGKELGDKYGVYQAEMLMAPPNIEIVKTEITEGGYYDNKMITCPNCGYWTSEQKSHNPCEKCKNVGKIEKKGPYIPETKKMVDMEINHGWQGVNANGFNALPCGYHKDVSEYESYDIKYREPIWWSTSTTSKNDPIIFQIKNNHGNTTAELSDDGKYYGRTYDSNFKPIPSGGFYVRYLKD